MRITIILLLLMQSINSIAQGPPEDRKEKIESLKIGYITKELNLTPVEAQQFWPIYNKFNDELEALRKNRKMDLLAAKLNFDSMSDADIMKLIDSDFQFQQQELDLRRKYIDEYKKVLPVRKVARLMRAEHMFKIELLKEFRERRGDGPPPPPPSPHGQ
jgi:hypothetical protein